MTMLLLRMLMTRQRSLSYEVWLELTAVIADSYLDRPLQLPTRQGGWQGGEGEGVGYYMMVDRAHITLGLGPAGTSLAFLPTQGKQVHYHPHTQHTNTTHTVCHTRKHKYSHNHKNTQTRTYLNPIQWKIFHHRYQYNQQNSYVKSSEVHFHS